MKTLLAAAILLFPTQAFAADQCFTAPDKDWTVVVMDRSADPEAPEMTLTRDGKTTDLFGMGAGTGISERIVTDESGATYSYAFADGALVFNGGTWAPCN